MGENFNLYSQYYDLLYVDKNYHAETNYVVDLIKKYHPNSKSILELGSGTGKHAYLLAERGFSILGLERSADMVAIANQKHNEKVTFQIGDITNFQINQSFDVATSLFHVISYLTDNQNLISTFNHVKEHLNDDGLFIFDVWYSPAVYHQVPEKRLKRLTNDIIEVLREANPIIYPDLNVVEVDYDITVTNLADGSTEHFKEKHPMRHFSTPEIKLLAYNTGFELLHAEEYLTKSTPCEKTWGVCYILKKI